MNSIESNKFIQNAPIDLNDAYIENPRVNPLAAAAIAHQMGAAFDEVQRAQDLESMPDELIDVLIKYGKNPNNWSPLNYALEMKDYSAAEVLIDAGIGLNGTGGGTPAVHLFNLQYGKEPKAYELLKKIISKGVDLQLIIASGVGYKINQGQMLLQKAIEHSRHDSRMNDILEMLLNQCKINPNFNINDRSLIRKAIQSRSIESIRSLLKHGAKIDDIDCFSFHWSESCFGINLALTAENFKESVMLLINHGANPLITSERDSKITAIDQLLKNVMAARNDPRNDSGNYLFKKEVIPFLMNLGAQIK